MVATVMHWPAMAANVFAHRRRAIESVKQPTVLPGGTVPVDGPPWHHRSPGP